MAGADALSTYTLYMQVQTCQQIYSTGQAEYSLVLPVQGHHQCGHLFLMGSQVLEVSCWACGIECQNVQQTSCERDNSPSTSYPAPDTAYSMELVRLSARNCMVE